MKSGIILKVGIIMYLTILSLAVSASNYAEQIEEIITQSPAKCKVARLCTQRREIMKQWLILTNPYYEQCGSMEYIKTKGFGFRMAHFRGPKTSVWSHEKCAKVDELKEAFNQIDRVIKDESNKINTAKRAVKRSEIIPFKQPLPERAPRMMRVFKKRCYFSKSKLGKMYLDFY